MNRNQPALLLVILLAFGACLTGVARAAQVEGVYEAEVPVADRSAKERGRALAVALAKVITKASGRRNPGSNPALDRARKRPSRYVQQFRYRALEPEPDAPPGTEPGLALWAQFDPAAIGQLLDEAGLPRWGRTRPSLLVWLAVDESGRRRVVGADDTGLTDVLRAAAEARAVPVEFPLMDLEDRARVSATDVWGGFRERILQASARYRNPTVLTGQAYRVLPTLWEARWRLFVDEGVEEWSVRGDILHVVLEEGVHGAADRLAARYVRSIAVAGVGRVNLTVEGVESLDDYAGTLNYLRSLDLVRAVHVTAVNADRVAFSLDTASGAEALRQVIALGRRLEPAEAGVGLTFRLAP